MTLKEKIKACLEDMTERDLIEVFNRYCDENQYSEDRFYPMCDIDMMFQDCSPTEIITALAKDFDIDAEYFRDGIWGVDSWSESEASGEILKNWVGDVAKYIAESREDFDNDDIAEVLDEEDSEGDDEE